MIRTLRKRPRPDDLKTQQRKATRSFGRLVYLGLVVLLGLGVLNYLFGDFVLMRADGLVVRDKTSVAATFVARIESVQVTAGQTVAAGDPLVQLQSTEMLERLAELSASQARLAARTVEFKIRSKMIENLLPLAVKRQEESGRVLEVFDGLTDRHLLTTARYDQALRSNYDARQEFVKLNAEDQALKDELSALDAARTDAATALADLRSHYAAGLMRATTGGSVGATVPSVGDVYRPGDTILSVYSGETYVLAFLPRRYLFAIRPGMAVRISNGRDSATGVVDEILPLTDAAPKEFQNSFKPTDRNQLARIRFDAKPPFPLHEKVTLTKTWSVF